jgi:hypothetical protein
MMKTTNRLDVEPEYRRYIHRLRNLCGQWKDDISFVRNDGTIYFAVDVDVIDMYLNPKLNASYGEIFGRESQTGQLVARLMGDSIFHSSLLPRQYASSSSNILLLIPPHDQELLYRLWAIAKNIGAGASSVSEDTFRVLDSIYEQYKRDRAGSTADLPGAVNSLLKRLIEHVPQLVTLFDEGEGDAAALKRFSLIDPAGLLNIFNLRRENGEYFILRTEEAFRDEISSLIKDWEARLTPYARGGQPRVNLANDARVLATIQHINMTLCAPKERLVLITGSRYLFNAMEAEGVPDLTNEEKDLRDDFLSLYLRHPQWIMSSRNFFRTKQEEEATKAGTGVKGSRVGEAPLSLERLLELMAPLDGGSMQSREQGDQIRAKGFAQVQESWNAEIRALAAVKYGSGLDKAKRVGAIKLATLISELQHAGTWSAFSFRMNLQKNVSQRTNTLCRDSSSLGLLDILAEPCRMMPALCFDPEFDDFNSIYKQLLQKMLCSGSPGSSRNSSGSEELIAQVNKDDKGEDRDPYHVNILHAAAFAARGHWRQVLTLCDNAIQIANGHLEEARTKSLNDKKPEYRRGREAAYLAAIARRRSARDTRDLDTAKAYLDLAVERKNVEDQSVLCLRFESEDLAISIRRMYLKYFSEDLQLSDEEKPGVCEEVKKNIETLKNIIDRAKAERSCAEGSSNERDMADWVLRQCYTNLFDLALILSDLEDRSIQAYGLHQLSSEFRDSIMPDDESRDHHAWLVSRVVGVLFESNESIAGVLGEISKKNDSLSMDYNKPMPWEKNRIERYKKLINKYAKK